MILSQSLLFLVINIRIHNRISEGKQRWTEKWVENILYWILTVLLKILYIVGIPLHLTNIRWKNGNIMDQYIINFKASLCSDGK
jgi:hypothetical protein